MDKCDVAVIGGGPGGVSAALYLARGGLKVSLFYSGDSALKGAVIQNYYGTGTVKGEALFNEGLEQAREVGAELIAEQALHVAREELFLVESKTRRVYSDRLVIATGRNVRPPDIEGIKELEGHGVSYCAVCDGFFYRKKKVAVLGAGDRAKHEYEYLKGLAGEVVLLTDGEGDDGDGRRIKRLIGDGRLKGVEFVDGAELELDGLFVAAGMLGANAIAKSLGLFTDGQGLITVDERRMTSMEGVYAVGDCTPGIKQVARAVCDGMTAGLDILSSLKGKSK